MPFQVYKPRGSSASIASIFPFKVSIVSTKSGIAANSFNLKCPCDTGDAAYSSQHFFKPALPDLSTSGKDAFVVFSGSQLYKSFDMQGSGYRYSYSSANPVYECEDAIHSPAVVIHGLNKPVFLSDFFNGDSNATLKIWLTVCFPSGMPSDDSYDQFTASVGGTTCVDCEERANKPITAFISCGITGWPKAAYVELINKGTAGQPRLEKRQIAANIPIAEVNSSGTVIKQYLNSNLMLTDMCVQGFPCKLPISTFSELG